jgi:hypothetical protein
MEWDIGLQRNQDLDQEVDQEVEVGQIQIQIKVEEVDQGVQLSEVAKAKDQNQDQGVKTTRQDIHFLKNKIIN